jgi:hypothetical protein
LKCTDRSLLSRRRHATEGAYHSIENRLTYPFSIGDVSEDFDKMNRGQDDITESQKVEKLQKRLTEQETELEIVKREPTPSEYPVS